VVKYEPLQDNRYKVLGWTELSMDEQSEIAFLLAKGCLSYPERLPSPSMFSFMDADLVLVRDCNPKTRTLSRPLGKLA
jgi:hypothetical protein